VLPFDILYLIGSTNLDANATECVRGRAPNSGGGSLSRVQRESKYPAIIRKREKIIVRPSGRD
jgi:hypothetical protein